MKTVEPLATRLGSGGREEEIAYPKALIECVPRIPSKVLKASKSGNPIKLKLIYEN